MREGRKLTSQRARVPASDLNVVTSDPTGGEGVGCGKRSRRSSVWEEFRLSSQPQAPVVASDPKVVTSDRVEGKVGGAAKSNRDERRSVGGSKRELRIK
ncbi:hypothetical protein KFK09_014180 [Dendrobium nobile]|uniref:Uncharacterized protein n=1 Tax=Dendrobium nobile TaxID=94219 RepID=A0A8T3BC86_DENNO|nr:hypothetical protein KFK09_014180 [Dendrobium nobile]